MTNATGISSVGYVFSGKEHDPTKSIVAGIQLQHRSYRMFLAGHNRKDVEACAKELLSKKLWFDVEKDSDLEKYASPCSMRKKFCQYSGVFYYRYRNLNEDVSPEDLKLMMSKHALYVKSNKDKFQDVINAFIT